MKRTVLILLLGVVLLGIPATSAQDTQPLQPATTAHPIPLAGDWKLYWVPEEGLGDHVENRGCLLITAYNEQNQQASANALLCVPANNLQLENTLVNCLGVNPQTAVCHVFIERLATTGEGGIGDRFESLLNNLAENGAGVFFFWDLHCSIAVSRTNYAIPPVISC